MQFYECIICGKLVGCYPSTPLEKRFCNYHKKDEIKKSKLKLHNIAERLRKTSEYNKLVDGRAEWLEGYKTGKIETINEILSIINHWDLREGLNKEMILDEIIKLENKTIKYE